MKAKALSRLLQIKQRQQRIERTELADADRSLEEAARHADSADALGKRMTHAMAGNAELCAAELALRAQLAGLAERDARDARNKLREREKVREAVGERVVAATREVRVFEHLTSRAKSEHERESRLREQVELDELSARKRGPR